MHGEMGERERAILAEREAALRAAAVETERRVEAVEAQARIRERQAEMAAIARMSDSIRGLDQASTLTDILDALALALLEKETLDHIEIAEIFRDVRKLPARPQWLSSQERPVSTLPPIEVPQRQDEATLAASTEAKDAGAVAAPAHRPATGQARPATA